MSLIQSLTLKSLFFFFLLCLISTQNCWVLAQKTPVDSTKIHIPKIRVYASQKITEKIFIDNSTLQVKDTVPLSYELPPLTNQLQTLQTDFKPNDSLIFAKKKDTLQNTKKTGGFAQLGAGNYASTQAEALCWYQPQTRQSLQIHFLHRASQLGEVSRQYSGFAQNALRGQYQHLFAKYIFNVSAGYQMQKNYFYGSQLAVNQLVDKNFLRQITEILEAKAQIQNVSKTQQFSIHWHQLFQRQRQTTLENAFTLSHHFITPLATHKANQLYKRTFEIDFNLTQATTQTPEASLSQQRWVLSLAPYFQVFKKNIFSKIGGAVFYLHNDINTQNNLWRFFLLSEFQYKFKKQWSISTHLHAKAEPNTLQTLLQENPFIAQNQALRAIYTRQIGLAVQKNWQSNRFVKVYAKFNNAQDMYFFNPILQDTAQMALFFQDVVVAKFGLQATHTWQEKFTSHLHIQYNHFSKINLHRPTFTTDLSVAYQVNKKLRLQSWAYIWAGMKAITYPEANTDIAQYNIIKSLKPIVDVNFEINYLFSQKFSTSLSFNNLLNLQYQRFYNYPLQRFNFLISLKYAF